jgi:hypothetical protein
MAQARRRRRSDSRCSARQDRHGGPAHDLSITAATAFIQTCRSIKRSDQSRSSSGKSREAKMARRKKMLSSSPPPVELDEAGLDSASGGRSRTAGTFDPPPPPGPGPIPLPYPN